MTFKSKYPAVEPHSKYADLVSNFFWEKLQHFADKTLFVDLHTGRQWTGGQIKKASANIARNLIKYGLRPHTNCVLFYKHNDYIQLTALGVLFAGASVCVGYDSDPEHEHAHMLQLLTPSVVFVRHELVQELVRHCRTLVDFKPCAIVIMDDDEIPASTFESLLDQPVPTTGPATTRILGLHAHLLTSSPGDDDERAKQLQRPVQIDPNWPAFILLTSGSTGRPKPAGRSQRNSLYVAHCLLGDAGGELWDLNESSVVLGHLALDHGTGIFQLKQNLALGFTCVLTNGYDLGQVLAALRKYQITDICLGSALVHKFLTSPEIQERESQETSCFKSLRNFIAVGSSIASQSVVRKFMARVPNCSIRQAMGMTECGFLTIFPRKLASVDNYPEDSRIVGHALPNVEFKLLALAEREQQQQQTDPATIRPPTPPREQIHEPEQQGELYVRGPTISPGYHGAAHAEQSRQVFGPDGFYKSGDICSFTRDGMLRIHGRISEVLCLYDGWKVLPAEIEQVLLEHPLVREAAVIGVPHPDLRTCHAPRAYIVARGGVAVDDDDEVGVPVNGHTVNGQRNGNGVNGTAAAAAAARLTKQEIFDFIAGRLSEPKHLVGGIRFMRELPKISIGKVDKKSLRKLDGLVA